MRRWQRSTKGLPSPVLFAPIKLYQKLLANFRGLAWNNSVSLSEVITYGYFILFQGPRIGIIVICVQYFPYLTVSIALSCSCAIKIPSTTCIFARRLGGRGGGHLALADSWKTRMVPYSDFTNVCTRVICFYSHQRRSMWWRLYGIGHWNQNVRTAQFYCFYSWVSELIWRSKFTLWLPFIRHKAKSHIWTKVFSLQADL